MNVILIQDLFIKRIKFASRGNVDRRDKRTSHITVKVSDGNGGVSKMGQKVNPIGYRLGVNKTWESKWYAKDKDFGDTLNKDIKIRKYISKNLKDAAVASLLLKERNKCEVTINTAKPGVIIGRGGEDIEKLRKSLSKVCW